MSRWWTFVRERFEPLSHLLMIACLFGANITLLKAVVFSSTPLDAARLTIAFVITVLFFFHLRLFDEIKDYQTDLEVNKDRPLPRGLIRMPEFKAVLTSVLALELVLSALLGLEATAALLIPWAYSILMYKEFFVGNWLRPKMEAYAISHTFVSGLLTLFFAVVVSGAPMAFLPGVIGWILLNNWMIFNTFEFARKTFGKDEERSHVESYSKRWGAFGAVLWVFFFSGMSFVLLLRVNRLTGWGSAYLMSLAIVTGILMLAGLIFVAKPMRPMAKIYRGVASLYLIVLNLVIIFL